MFPDNKFDFFRKIHYLISGLGRLVSGVQCNIFAEGVSSVDIPHEGVLSAIALCPLEVVG